jgi:hypothetical protein
MNDEQPTSGTPVNPAPNANAPRPGAPVMDVVPPPAQPAAPAPEVVEPPVVAAPPEESAIPPVSDDIAEQIATDNPLPSTTGPDGQPGEPQSAMAIPPEEQDEQATEAGDSPDKLIESESKHEEALAPAPQQTQVPKASNPATTAVIATVFLMIILAGLAVVAYMMSQKQ